jgi:hypothetical protein
LASFYSVIINSLRNLKIWTRKQNPKFQNIVDNDQVPGKMKMKVSKLQSNDILQDTFADKNIQECEGGVPEIYRNVRGRT